MRGLKTAKEARTKVSAIHPKVVAAVGVMLKQPKHDLASVAREVGLSTNQLRDYLSRPSVIQYLRQRRRGEVESLCAGNIQALRRLRDEGPPTAAVNAIRTAEAVRAQLVAEEGAAGAAARRSSPGLVIIVGPAPHGVTVDQPRRLGAARSIAEPGAIDREVLNADIAVEDDEPASR